jgi:hypothetical protein
MANALGVSTVSVDLKVNDGIVERTSILRLGPTGRHKNVEITIIELYWAFLIRNATNLPKVLSWFGWAVFRELQSRLKNSDSSTLLFGSWFRFIWLGTIVAELLALVGLLVWGMAWFSYCGLRLAYQEVFDTGIGAPSVWLVHDLWPFILFSIGIRGLFVLSQQGSGGGRGSTTQAGPPRQAIPAQVGKPPWPHVLLIICIALVVAYFSLPNLIVVLRAVANCLGSKVQFLQTIHWPLLTFSTSAIWAACLVAGSVVISQWCSVSGHWTRLKAYVPAYWALIWGPTVLTALFLPLLAWTIVTHVRKCEFLINPGMDTAFESLAFTAVTLYGVFVLFNAAAALLKGAPSGSLRRLIITTAAFAMVFISSYYGLLIYQASLSTYFIDVSILLLAFSAVKTLLVDYFGDIAVFITQDEIQASFDIRLRILEAANRKLLYLLDVENVPGSSALQVSSATNYNKVAVFAHSLGCCVTYDTLCRLQNRAWAQSRDQSRPEDAEKAKVVMKRISEKLALYTTYGCILEVVKFYFGRRASNSTHFDKLNELGQLRFGVTPPTNEPPFPAAHWCNIRSLMDCFTWPGLVSFGKPETIEVRSMVWPVYAHVDYANNRDVLECLRDLTNKHLL